MKNIKTVIVVALTIVFSSLSIAITLINRHDNAFLEPYFKMLIGIFLSGSIIGITYLLFNYLENDRSSNSFLSFFSTNNVIDRKLKKLEAEIDAKYQRFLDELDNTENIGQYINEKIKSSLDDNILERFAEKYSDQAREAILFRKIEEEIDELKYNISGIRLKKS